MRTVFLAGGIGSGKSTVAKELERLGAARIDLDQVSREVLAAGSPVTQRIAEAFGADVLDPDTGELNRGLLALRAFATPQDADLLEEIELPAIRDLLAQRLQTLSSAPHPPALCVVEVPLLNKVGEAISLADQVLVVSCPLDVRRERAIGRGMTAEDFDARAARQPSEEWLRAHATAIIENSGSWDQTLDQVNQWYQEQAVLAQGQPGFASAVSSEAGSSVGTAGAQAARQPETAECVAEAKPTDGVCDRPIDSANHTRGGDR